MAEPPTAAGAAGTSGATVLIVDDVAANLNLLREALEPEGYRILGATSGEDALEVVTRVVPDLILLDVVMEGVDGLQACRRLKQEPSTAAVPVIFITMRDDPDEVAEGFEAGGVDYITKPFRSQDVLARVAVHLEISRLTRDLQQHNRLLEEQRAELAVANANLQQEIQRRRHAEDHGQRLRETIRGLQVASHARSRDREFLGDSPAAAQIREQIQQAVESQCDTILVTGETGTGKEVVARQIHFSASSDERPFIAVSCPALPDTLVESELFGHVKGAFTGAGADRAGYFELADGGTLLLDEVADLSPSAQAALLRVLETRALRRVGGTREIEVDLRLVTSSNVSLEERAESGTFRSDLLYRLNHYTIHLPPLRERRADILPLARHFLQTYATPRGLLIDGYSPESEDLLQGYAFPGNARELRNVVERAAILCRSGAIVPEHLCIRTSAAQAPAATGQPDDDPEKVRLLKVLEETRWNRREAARRVGVSYATLRRRIERLGLG